MIDRKKSKLLTYDQLCICIRTNLCHEIRIRRMQIFLSFVTTQTNTVKNIIVVSLLNKPEYITHINNIAEDKFIPASCS